MSNSVNINSLLTAVDQATRPFQKIETANVSLSHGVKETEKTLRGLYSQVAQIDSFTRAQRALTDVSGQLKTAKEHARSLAAEMKNSGAPTQTQTKALEKARESVSKLSQQHNTLRLSVKNQRQTLLQAGISTRAPATAKTRLQGQIGANSEQLTAQRQALRQQNSQARLAKIQKGKESVEAMGAKVSAVGNASMSIATTGFDWGKKLLQPGYEQSLKNGAAEGSDNKATAAGSSSATQTLISAAAASSRSAATLSGAAAGSANAASVLSSSANGSANAASVLSGSTDGSASIFNGAADSAGSANIFNNTADYASTTTTLSSAADCCCASTPLSNTADSSGAISILRSAATSLSSAANTLRSAAAKLSGAATALSGAFNESAASAVSVTSSTAESAPAGEVSTANGASAQAGNLGTDLSALQAAYQSLSFDLFSQQEASLRKLVQTATEYVGKLQEWVSNNQGLTQTLGLIATVVIGVAGAIGTVASVIAPVFTGISTLITVATTFGSVFTTVGGAIMTVLGGLTLPIIGIIAAIAAAAAAVYYFWEPISAFFGGVVEGIKTAFAPIAELFTPFQPVFDQIGQAISGVTDWFSKLAGPIHSTQETLEKCGGAGKIVGQALFEALTLPFKPLLAMIEGVSYLAEAFGFIKKQPPIKLPEPQAEPTAGGAMFGAIQPGKLTNYQAVKTSSGGSYVDQSKTDINITLQGDVSPGSDNSRHLQEMLKKQEEDKRTRLLSQFNLSGGYAP